MNYFLHEFKVNSSKIYLLEFDNNFDPQEYLDTLTEIELERYLEFKSDKRKKEFIAIRILKNQLFGYQEIKYESHGAPYIHSDSNENTFISISHAKNLVGIACNTDFQVGFDIEQVKPKITKIFHKFLNSQEKEIFDLDNTSELTSCWSFKETLYKLAGRKLIDFKTELLLLEKTKNRVKGKIINPKEEILVDLHCFEFKNNVITINSSEVVRIHA